MGNKFNQLCMFDLQKIAEAQQMQDEVGDALLVPAHHHHRTRIGRVY